MPEKNKVKNSSNDKNVKVRKRSTKVPWIRPVVVETEDGNTMLGHSILLSNTGIGIRIAGLVDIGESVMLHILVGSQWRSVSAKVTSKLKNRKTDINAMRNIAAVFSEPSTSAKLWRLSRMS